jgi:hypothetical protein
MSLAVGQTNCTRNGVCICNRATLERCFSRQKKARGAMLRMNEGSRRHLVRQLVDETKFLLALIAFSMGHE